MGGAGFVGVLRCAQDDSKNLEATARATARARTTAKAKDGGFWLKRDDRYGWDRLRRGPSLRSG